MIELLSASVLLAEKASAVTVAPLRRVVFLRNGAHCDLAAERHALRVGLRDVRPLRPYERSDLKPARISSERNFGCSQAAK